VVEARTGFQVANIARALTACLVAAWRQKKSSSINTLAFSVPKTSPRSDTRAPVDFHRRVQSLESPRLVELGTVLAKSDLPRETTGLRARARNERVRNISFTRPIG